MENTVDAAVDTTVDAGAAAVDAAVDAGAAAVDTAVDAGAAAVDAGAATGGSVADIVTSAGSVSTIVMVLAVVLIVLSVVLCVIILLQSKRSAGLGAVSAASSTDTYWSRNKGNSMEGALERYTKIGGALFMILAFAINLLS